MKPYKCQNCRKHYMGTDDDKKIYCPVCKKAYLNGKKESLLELANILRKKESQKYYRISKKELKNKMDDTYWAIKQDVGI